MSFKNIVGLRTLHADESFVLVLFSKKLKINSYKYSLKYMLIIYLIHSPTSESNIPINMPI